MQQVQNAAVLLARRYNCTTSLHTAARISMIGNEKQSGMAYAHKLLQQFLLKWEWNQAYAYLKEQKVFQVRDTVCHLRFFYEYLIQPASIIYTSGNYNLHIVSN